MKTKLVAMTLLAAGSMFAQTHFSAGIGFGGPVQGFSQPAPFYASNVPPCPGPDYSWVDGYWSQNRTGNTWIAGYWTRQPFSRGFSGARYEQRPFEQPRFDDRFRNGDRQSFDRGFDQDRNRGFAGNRDGDRGVDRDDISGPGRSNNRGNGFRGR